jgi:glycosyltransferase involved in cell wall biosynthesis
MTMPTPVRPNSLSVIVPVGARRADLKSLYAEYKAGVAATGLPFEFVFVLDGPRPEAHRILDELLRQGEDFTVVSLTRCFGEAAALMAGFERSTGDIVLTLPAYFQVDPTDFRKLIAGLENFDVAIAKRSPRVGNVLDKMRRSAFHSMVRFVTGLRFSDLGCGVRALRRRVLEELDLYGDQHRYIAILATRLGFRVNEIAVRQSAKDRFVGAYRPRQYAHHFLDLFSIFFLVRFTKRPLRFFGMLGASTFAIGAVLILYLGLDRIFFDAPLADRPALLLAALLLVLGLQVFALGLLGELIIFTHARDLKDYRVDEVIEYAEPAAEADSNGIGSLRTDGTAPPAAVA